MARERHELHVSEDVLLALLPSPPPPNNPQKFRYCEYLGKYFCTSCHAGAQRVIPARVMHNWDFRQYRVSSFSAHLLDNVRTQPLFDFRVVNEPALRRVKALATATTLRRQLGHLRAYLMACRGGTSLLQTIEDPPHMATEQTLYSMKDVCLRESGGGWLRLFADSARNCFFIAC